MNTLVLLSILSLLVGCHPNPNSASEKKAKYVPLSLEDSKKLITPTVYYIPQFDQSDLSCGVTLEMKDKSGKVIVTVCKDTYDSCVMQGTCLVKKSEVKILINVVLKLTENVALRISQALLATMAKVQRMTLQKITNLCV